MLNSNKADNGRKQRSYVLPILIALICIFMFAGIILINSFMTNFKKAGNAAFDTTYNDTKQETYDGFKQKAFNYYEAKNHVSNRATITIGNIKEENSLEVLSVSESWIKINDGKKSDDNTTRWIEFSATGIYTVDMTMSQFIIDDNKGYVLVKLQTPQLTQFALDTSPVVKNFNYEEGMLRINGNYDNGVKMHLEDRAEAYQVLKERISGKDEDLTAAKASTETLIRTFIRSVNPELDLKDSDIIIEFT